MWKKRIVEVYISLRSILRTYFIEDFPSLFFRDKHQHQAVPFIFDREKDGYELDPTQCDENCYSDLYAERNERRSLFARDLRSFKNGTSVFKHCLPWGQFNVLNNESFLIQMKFFNAYGEVTSIVLKDETTERIYSVEPKFFPGWSDPTCMKAYYDYCVSK